MTLIGGKIAKIDGMSLVKGTPAYTSDLDLVQNVLTVKILRSPHPSARILSIDKGEAEAIPGVECVLTWQDVPDTQFTLAGQSYPEPSPYDRRILEDRVRYVGDEVAIVAAVDEATALEAMGTIKVDYEILEPILTLEDALEAKQLVHGRQPHTNFDVGNDASKNIAASHLVGKRGCGSRACSL